ncbi:MAG: RIP metalloprotease RseP [Prevotella sp.]|nr:RIP metalloprotease RseP [Prevotella sp.]MDY6230698.1 RIP metalloprotease RseP [Prevotella sp.]
MEIFLIKLLQFILAISLLVLLHEGGHFFFSKLFGVRVEKFYLFFDPSIWKWDGSIFKWKPKKSDTTYGIGWLPLGGYCKISGMIDESFDTEQMQQPVQKWEFRAKPAWQRLLIMIGGVLVNFLLALFIYAMVLYTWGDTYISTKDMTMGMKFNSEAKALGFQDGDMLVGTDKRTFDKFDIDVYRAMADADRIDVRRDGKIVGIDMQQHLNLLEMLKTQPAFARPFIPAEIDSVVPGTPAAKAGMQKGDKIMAINGNEIDSWNSFDYEMSRLSDVMTAAENEADSMRTRTVTVAYSKKNSSEVDTVDMILTPDLRLGVNRTSLLTYYKETHRTYSFMESLPAGVKYGWNTLRGYVGDMRYLFSSDGAKSLGGFGAIGSLFPAQWDWQLFWLMTAFLSIILAFMNILPIPALDGGHVLFLLYEMITGKTPSDKFMVWAEYIGFGILILLMVVANLNDILRWLGYM